MIDNGHGAPVLRGTEGTDAFGNGAIPAKSRHLYSFGRNSKFYQAHAHSVRPLSREADIVVARSRVIGMAFNGDGQGWLALQPMRLRIDGGASTDAEFGVPITEENTVAHAAAKLAPNTAFHGGEVWDAKLHGPLRVSARDEQLQNYPHRKDRKAKRSPEWHVARSPTLMHKGDTAPAFGQNFVHCAARATASAKPNINRPR
jgi:hypothetical protein